MTDKAEATLRSIVLAVADMDPVGLLECDHGWSEVTPGTGPSEGCVFCKSLSATDRGGHDDDCAWLRARLFAYGPL